MKYAWLLLVPLAACGSKETPAPAPTVTPAPVADPALVIRQPVKTDRGAIFHCPNGYDYQTQVDAQQGIVRLSKGGKQSTTLNINQAKQGVTVGDIRYQLDRSALTVTTGNDIETCFAQPLPVADGKSDQT